jgi:hypothetical protein
VEKLEAGKFEDKLIQSVMGARNFVLVLSAGALDKCMQDHDCKDWVHKVGGRPSVVVALAQALEVRVCFPTILCTPQQHSTPKHLPGPAGNS